MPIVTAFNKEAERIFKEMATYKKGYTFNSNFPKIWARRYPELDSYIDIMRCERKQKTGFIPLPNVMVIPRKKKYEIIRLPNLPPF